LISPELRAIGVFNTSTGMTDKGSIFVVVDETIGIVLNWGILYLSVGLFQRMLSGTATASFVHEES